MSDPLATFRGLPSQAMYPVSMSIFFDTGIQTSATAIEQRWKRSSPKFSFSLPLQALNSTDVAAQFTEFANLEGLFGNNASLTFPANAPWPMGGTTFSNLAFQFDELPISRQDNSNWSTTLKLKQVSNQGYATGTPLMAFPSFAVGSGVVTQLPFVDKRRYKTSAVDTPSGWRYSYEFYGTAGLMNFPSMYLSAWEVNLPVLQDADLRTIVNAVIGWNGELSEFSFTNPNDATVHPHVRLALPNGQLVVNFNSYNSSSVKLNLIETFN